MVDIGNIGNKIIGGIEKHAAVLAFVGSVYARHAEYTGDPALILANLTSHFTNLNIPRSDQVGMGGYGALGEAVLSIQNPRILADKLFGKHAFGTLVKVGVGLWLAGELGIVPGRYADIGKKVATGAGVAALVMPGSSGSNSGSNSSNSRGYA